MTSPDTLVCIPYYNYSETILDALAAVLRNPGVEVLVVDDLSDVPLQSIIDKARPHWKDRVTVLRPERKVYSGGGRNIGIRYALEHDYRYLILMDSDIFVPGHFVTSTRTFFRSHPNDVVVAPTITPSGNRWQYADTLINFSSYLPNPIRVLSFRGCLAGYAFALNLAVFRKHPIFHENRFGGEDVLFFKAISRRFGMKRFPIMNNVMVRHLPPRSHRQDAMSAQKRYGRSFFTHCDAPREAAFRRVPWLHYLTPRWVLMLYRMITRGRWCDFHYVPYCWQLDFARAQTIVKLQLAGFHDPAQFAKRR